ncbi:helix-turn-helix and ligand-binding sensor domain-containing protein [Flavobacterium microcysteis]|uniref:helix-turn-helix and ligand-binding sensor domain-containing protein n=1 Tax=Flavobacterium microcysteis TaxID=2596891 RepID=UPI001F163810|nr:histidine kinase [Flavobacterium microcysteis]
MKLKFVQFLFFCFFSLCIQAQELLPFVENFTKSDYNGDNQVWNVTQGGDNAMYFANNHYFLRYNGVKWEKYALPNKTVIRSIFIDGDKVYSGSYKEFGYWKRINGKMEYFSLTKGKNIFQGGSDNEEIWKIFKYKDKLYFQTFNEIFIYDGKKIQKVEFPSQISYCYLIDNEIYVATVREGIYMMEGTNFVKRNNWDILKENVIHHIEKHQGRVYIFTKNNGVFVVVDGNLIPWSHPLNEVIKKEVLVTAKFVDENTLVVGSGLQGIYIINLKNGSYQNLNRQNALKNNAILSIGVDKEKDLWLGLDNGICHVEINSPVQVFSDSSGILGSVYSLSTIDNGYLFVTNHGIFTCKNKILEVLPNSQGQVWDIFKRGNEFIIGHNDGTFLYDGRTARLQKVSPINGGWKFLKGEFENVYFQGNYAGIVVYEDINDLSKYKLLGGLKKPIKNLAQNKKGELWAADNYRSLYRILYDNNFNVKKIENVSLQNGIKNDYGVKLFSYKNEILFLIDNNWYVYNSISGKLEKDKIFNASFKNTSDIIPINDENFIVLKNGLLYVVSQVKDQFVWELIPEKYYEGRIIMENIKIYQNGDHYLMNLDDGFISFKINNNRRHIQGVYAEAFYHDKLIDKNTRIKYNQSVEVNVISEYFGYNRPDLFYKLNDSNGYVPIKRGNLILNNLSSGLQELEFYYNDGTKYSKVAAYTFTVRKPWYFSFWMVMFYILIISGSFFLYYRWNKIRYLEKIKLKEEELKHQKEILELELNAENKLKLQEYEKHILEIEVQNKAYEVAGKSLSIAKQSEMIDSIQEILETEKDVNQIKSKIKKSIKINALNKNEWESFEHNLMQSHEEFVHKLSNKFPMLTSKDIKLCIYLKMNLSSKEIAPLMNISFRGVELHRYRLRKKLGLTSDDNLSKFMINV